MIKDNLRIIRKKIISACEKCGTDPDSIILVAVSKTFPVSNNLDAINANHLDFGENKIQELVRKRSYLLLNGNTEARWHMIGHLQSNKAKLCAENADMFHCLDSVKLARRLNKYCEASGRKLDVLVQINSSGEKSKSGIDPSELEPLLNGVGEFTGINISGLMSIGEFNEDPEDSREEFRFMKDLFDRSKRFNGGNIQMEYLSMGMSNDFEQAIEEGANIIRVGTAIFGAREQ